MMAGFVRMEVSFPKIRGFEESGLLKLADRVIATWLDQAIDEIKANWYKFVTRRTGRSGDSWNVTRQALFDYVITNYASYRGREYAGYVHPAGARTPLVKTLVRRILAKYRKKITAALLASRSAGGRASPTSITFKDAVKDALKTELAAAVAGV